MRQHIYKTIIVIMKRWHFKLVTSALFFFYRRHLNMQCRPKKNTCYRDFILLIATFGTFCFKQQILISKISRSWWSYHQMINNFPLFFVTPFPRYVFKSLPILSFLPCLYHDRTTANDNCEWQVFPRFLAGFPPLFAVVVNCVKFLQLLRPRKNYKELWK